MQYVKTLGLAVAAAALMAFAGASTAAATVLCTEPGVGTPTGTTCPNGSAELAGTTVEGTLDPGTGPAYLTVEAEVEPGVFQRRAYVECKKSALKGKTENEGSATATVTGKIETLSFEECLEGLNNSCTVTTLKSGTFEVHWISGTHNGTLRSSGAEITTQCPSIFGNIHCIYTSNGTDLGEVTGGNTGTMDIESAGFKALKTSGLCYPELFWDGKYEVTKPKPLYIASHT